VFVLSTDALGRVDTRPDALLAAKRLVDLYDKARVLAHLDAQFIEGPSGHAGPDDEARHDLHADMGDGAPRVALIALPTTRTRRDGVIARTAGAQRFAFGKKSCSPSIL